MVPKCTSISFLCRYPRRSVRLSATMLNLMLCLSSVKHGSVLPNTFSFRSHVFQGFPVRFSLSVACCLPVPICSRKRILNPAVELAISFVLRSFCLQETRFPRCHRLLHQVLHQVSPLWADPLAYLLFFVLQVMFITRSQVCFLRASAPVSPI